MGREREGEGGRREGVCGVCERLNRLAAVKSSGNARDPPFVSISWVPAKSDRGGRAGGREPFVIDRQDCTRARGAIRYSI